MNYTTSYEDEPIEGEAQKAEAVKKSTTPSDSELFDMLIKREAQQSRRDTPKFGNEFDVQGANKDSEAFANRLEQIKKEMDMSDQFAIDQLRKEWATEKLLEKIREREQIQMGAAKIKAPDQSKAQMLQSIP